MISPPSSDHCLWVIPYLQQRQPSVSSTRPCCWTVPFSSPVNLWTYFSPCQNCICPASYMAAPSDLITSPFLFLNRAIYFLHCTKHLLQLWLAHWTVSSIRAALSALFTTVPSTLNRLAHSRPSKKKKIFEYKDKQGSPYNQEARHLPDMANQFCRKKVERASSPPCQVEKK